MQEKKQKVTKAVSFVKMVENLPSESVPLKRFFQVCDIFLKVISPPRKNPEVKNYVICPLIRNFKIFGLKPRYIIFLNIEHFGHF